MFTTNSPVRIILPGLGDVNELEQISRLTGERDEWWAPNQAPPRQTKVMTAPEIRGMPADQALMIYRGSAPALVHLPLVWDIAHWKQRVLDSQESTTGSARRVSCPIGRGRVRPARRCWDERVPAGGVAVVAASRSGASAAIVGRADRLGGVVSRLLPAHRSDQGLLVSAPEDGRGADGGDVGAQGGLRTALRGAEAYVVAGGAGTTRCISRCCSG